MGLKKVGGQAVELYEQTDTLFNDKTSVCEWHLDYDNIIGCTDISEVIVDTEVVSTNLQTDGVFAGNVEGTTSGDFAFKLSDSSGAFLSTVVIGMFVRDLGNNTSAIVTAVDSDTLLTLDTDIFNLGEPLPYDINYYELSPSMSISGGLLHSALANVGSAKQYPLDIQYLLYKVQIDVFSFNSGTNGQKIKFKIGGDVVLELDETVLNTGTFTMFGYNSGASFQEFEIEVDSDIECSFDNLIISQYSNSIFFIVDSSNDKSVYSSALTDALVSATQDQIKMSVDWSNVDCDSCYYIAIMEDVSNPDLIGTERVVNGDFATDTNWTKGSGWSIGSGRAYLTLPSSAGDLVQLYTSKGSGFSEGLCYNIDFDVVEYGEGAFNVVLYNGGVVIATSQLISSGGSYTFNTGVLSASIDKLAIVPSSAVTQVWGIDNISGIINVACSGYKFRSDDYNVTSDLSCTVKLSGANNDNAFGIDFVGLDYSPTIRVSGELLNPSYEGDKINEEDSLGSTETLYFKSTEMRNLFLYQLPKHLHNFVRLLMGYDNLFIDDVGYVSTDAKYEPKSERIMNKVPDLSSVTKELRLKEDFKKNRFC